MTKTMKAAGGVAVLMMLAGCGATVEQRAATGAVGGAAGTVVGQASRPN